MPKRTYTTDEPFVAEADLAHFGPAPLPDLVPTWTIRDDQGREVASGTLQVQDRSDRRADPPGNGPRLALPPPRLPAA